VSLYDDAPEERWEAITRELIAAHPLEPDEIVEVVKVCWEDIFESSIGRRGLRIGTDIFPTPQIMATLMHELIAAEFQSRYPDSWRRDTSGDDKDLVFIPDPAFSTEIKCSSSANSIYANRSYAQQHTENKKARAGYFIGVNFQKFARDLLKRPAIRRVSFGWLDWTDWIPQASPTGQQAYLSAAAKKYKMVTLWSHKG
jgi:hypothetical protein